MFGISIVDVILSSAMSLTSLPAPKETPNIWKGLGSQLTCDTQGFFFMLGASTGPMYFLSLQLYYLCVIKYDLSLDYIKTIEPYFHGVPIIFGLVSAIIPLSTGSINAGTSWCWIQAIPMGCQSDEDIECNRGTNAALQRWVFVGGPMLLILVLTCIVMWMIYDSVRKLDQTNASYDFRNISGNNSPNRRVKEDMSSARASIHSSILPAVRGMLRFSTSTPRLAARYRRSRNARQRIFQYFVAYLLTISFPIVNVSIAMAIGGPVNFLEILQYIFYPLQGFFNIVVFILPSVMRLQERHSEMYLPRVVITAITSYIGPNSMNSRRASLNSMRTSLNSRRLSHQTTDMRLSQTEIDIAASRVSAEDNDENELPSSCVENVDIPPSTRIAEN